VADGEEPTIELAGIGAVLSAKDDVLLIGRVVEGGGAAEAGLTVGDAILAVDGAPVARLGFAGSIQRIRGPEGTAVQLSVRKVGAEDAVTLAVTRRRLRAR
jgi:C-terminal processing protease CtpA/Prc